MKSPDNRSAKEKAKQPTDILHFNNNPSIKASFRTLFSVHFRLESAAEADMERLLCIHGSHSKYDKNMKWLDGDPSPGAALKRLGMALVYINDSDMSNESMHLSTLFDVQSLAARITSFRLENNKKNNDEETLELIKHINSSLIALIARGEVNLAADIIHFAGTLRSLCDGELDGNKNKKLNIPLEQIRILLALFSFLGEGKIPTKKALRLKYNSRVDNGRFSNLLNGMDIKDALPDNPKHPDGDKDGKVWNVMAKEYQSEGIMNDGEAERRAACYDGSRFTTTHTFHARRSKQYKGFELKMRNIRKTLGPVYWLLLIQLGMPDIEQEADLDRFVQGLSGLGLKLIQ